MGTASALLTASTSVISTSPLPDLVKELQKDKKGVIPTPDAIHTILLASLGRTKSPPTPSTGNFTTSPLAAASNSRGVTLPFSTRRIVTLTSAPGPTRAQN